MAKASGSITMMDENETIHVLLSNESVSITCDKDGASPVMSGTSTVVFASQGISAVAFTISGITAVGCNGLITGGTTVSIVNDSTLVANNSGYIDISIVVMGTTYVKRFGFSKSKTGASGSNGSTGAVGTSYRAKGAWAAAIAYVNNATYIDIITSNGSTFYCKLSHTSLNGSNNPSAAIPPVDNTYWGVSSMQGSQGPIGAGYTNKGAWLIGTAYTKTTSNIDTVNCEGNLYACVLSATGQNPIGNPTYWTLIVSKGSDGANTMKRGSEMTWTKVNVTMDIDGGFYKTSPGVAATWDSQAYSTEKYTGGAILSFENFLVNHSTMMGLTTTPTTNASYTSIAYAWQIANATYNIYESGTSRAITGAAAIGDVFTITYDGEYVRYYMNSVLKRSVAVVIALPLYADSSFSVIGGVAQIGNIHFGGYSDKSPTLDWVSAWTGQSTLIKDISIVSPKIFAGINGGTSTTPNLTGVAIGRDVLGGSNTNIGIVVYNANVPIVRINANGSASFGRTVADGGVAGQQFLVNANGSITTPKIQANDIVGGTLTLGGSVIAAQGVLIVKDASNNPIMQMDKNGFVVTEGNIKVIAGYVPTEGYMGIFNSSAVIGSQSIDCDYSNMYWHNSAKLSAVNGLELKGDFGGMGAGPYTCNICVDVDAEMANMEANITRITVGGGLNVFLEGVDGDLNKTALGVDASGVHVESFFVSGSIKSWYSMSSNSQLIGDYNENGPNNKMIWTIGGGWNTWNSHYGLAYENALMPLTQRTDHAITIRGEGVTHIRLGMTTGEINTTGDVTAGGTMRSGGYAVITDRHLQSGRVNVAFGSADGIVQGVIGLATPINNLTAAHATVISMDNHIDQGVWWNVVMWQINAYQLGFYAKNVVNTYGSSLQFYWTATGY